jgi:hypothetical protein
LYTTGDVTHFASPYPGVSWLTDDGTFVANLIKVGPGEAIENLGDHIWMLPVNGTEVTWTPAPPDLAGAIDRRRYWSHTTNGNLLGTIFTIEDPILQTATRTVALDHHVGNFVSLPNGGFAAVGESVLIENPNAPGVWLESSDLSKAKSMREQGWAIVPELGFSK